MIELKSKFSLDVKLLLKKITIVLFSSFFCFLIIFVIVLGPRPYKGDMQEGNFAKMTIKADRDFDVETSIDEEATESRKEEAAGKIDNVYDLDGEKLKESIHVISSFFSNLSVIKENETLIEKEKLLFLKEKSEIELKDSLFTFLLQLKDNELEEFKETNISILRVTMSKPIMAEEEKKRLLNKSETITVKNKESERKTAVVNVWTPGEARLYARDLINKSLKKKEAKTISIDIVNQAVRPNLIFNEKITEDKKEKAKAEVLPVYHKDKITKNTPIIKEGDVVTKEHIRYLKLLQEEQSQDKKNIYYYVSITLFVIILFVLFWLYLKLYQKEIISNARYLILIGLLSFISIILAKIIPISPIPSYLIPLASISMLIAILLNSQLAIVATVFLSIFIGIISGRQLYPFLYGLAGGLAGIYSVRKVRRRGQLLKAGLLVGLISALTIIAIDSFYNLGKDIILKDSLLGIFNGFICAFIVMGILPVLEYIFEITTDISLLELSDLNNPILKEMVIKAPGTYHHSLIVGNLAESAADSIGANSLLARVGAYYHDIGKLVKPEYFSENQMEYDDKHAELTPKMSSLVITNHIKEGVELAKKHRLNKAIIDFIQQHHGTSSTFYFYQRALEKEDKGGEAREEDFRYPGPLPQTKEVAIVLLADSVEAATRAISQPTAVKIKKTVQKIINNKFIDGQLNDCDLTLKNLHNISESFSMLLAGIYHSRVEYPEPDEDK